MRVVCVKEDVYVLCPAGRSKDGASGDEVVNAGACAAPQQDSFAERLMRCPQDDGDLASAGVDQPFGAAYAYSVCCDDAPDAIDCELPGCAASTKLSGL